MHIIRHVTQSMEDLPQDWNYHKLDFPCLRVVYKHKNGGLQRPPHGLDKHVLSIQAMHCLSVRKALHLTNGVLNCVDVVAASSKFE